MVPRSLLADPKYLELLSTAGSVDKGSRSEFQQKATDEFGVSRATFYNHLRRLKSNPIRTKKYGSRSGLPQSTESAIKKVIEDFFLQPSRPSKEQAWQRLEQTFYNNPKIPTCSKSTFLRRLNAIPEAELWQQRRDPKLANKKFRVSRGTSPTVSGPLSLVQIDHKRLDIECVDSVHRLPCGRPWLTCVIDVYTGAPLGFHLGYEEPSRVSVGLAITRTVCPKEDWIDNLGLECEWPLFGTPHQVACDNGADFTSRDTINAYLSNGMQPPVFRPVGQPQYGGKIERFFRTIGMATKATGGDTGNSVADRQERFPEKTANKTLVEVEKLLVLYICEYIRRPYQKVLPPLALWDQAVKDGTGTLCKRAPSDPVKFLRSFFPSVRRTITSSGVNWDREQYVDDILNQFLLSGETQQVFRRDPRDIRHIYLEHPGTGELIPIPHINSNLPIVSSQERKNARNALRDIGLKYEDPDLIQSLRSHMRDIEEEATALTVQSKRKRKAAEKQLNYSATDQPHKSPTPSDTISDDNDVNLSQFGFRERRHRKL